MDRLGDESFGIAMAAIALLAAEFDSKESVGLFSALSTARLYAIWFTESISDKEANWQSVLAVGAPVPPNQLPRSPWLAVRIPRVFVTENDDLADPSLLFCLFEDIEEESDWELPEEWEGPTVILTAVCGGWSSSKFMNSLKTESSEESSRPGSQL